MEEDKMRNSNPLKAWFLALVLVVFMTFAAAAATAEEPVQSDSVGLDLGDAEDGEVGYGEVSIFVEALINQTTKDDIIDILVWGFVLIIIISVLGYVIKKLRA